MIYYLKMGQIEALGLCSRATQPSCHQHTHCQHPPRQWPIDYGLLLIWHCSLQHHHLLSASQSSARVRLSGMIGFA